MYAILMEILQYGKVCLLQRYRGLTLLVGSVLIAQGERVCVCVYTF